MKHTGWKGTTGQGKTVLIMKHLGHIRQKKERGIVLDLTGSLVDRWFDPTQDILLNPFDARCPNWDVWSEGCEMTDFQNLAVALIPEEGMSDQFWAKSARDIFTNTADRMAITPDRSTTKLLEIMLRKPLGELTEFLMDTEAANLLEAKKTAISIKSVLATYVKSLRFLEGLDKDEQGRPRPAFSITEWVKDESKSGWIFISADSQRREALKPLITMWIDIAQRAVSSMGENPDRRLHFILDEVNGLNKLPTLRQGLAEHRKFGACYGLGIQSNAQTRATYGRDDSQAIDDLLNTLYQLRQPSEPMAKEASGGLGMEEVETVRDNRSIGPNAISDRTNIGFQIVERPLVTYSEIMSMKPLTCYLKPADDSPVMKLDLKFDEWPKVAEAFMPRKIPDTRNIEQLANHAQMTGLLNTDTGDREQHWKMQKEAMQTEDEREQARLLEQKVQEAKQFAASDNQQNKKQPLKDDQQESSGDALEPQVQGDEKSMDDVPTEEQALPAVVAEAIAKSDLGQ